MPAKDDRNRKARRILRAEHAREVPHTALSRLRRGYENVLLAEWRRCEIGTNHISSFGVWRPGTRRQPARPNRAGTTRWHKPYGAAATDER